MTENVIKKSQLQYNSGGGGVKRKIVILCRVANNFVKNDKKIFRKRDRSRKNQERYRNRCRTSETEQGGGTGEEKALHRHRKVCAEHPGMPKPMDSFPVLCYYKE